MSEIWITFPDPQHAKERKRLTSPMFLERYRRILATGSNAGHSGNGRIHLKTDDTILYLYTLDDIVLGGGLPLFTCSDNVYSDSRPELEDVRSVQTFYEQMWLRMGKKIKYICFGLKLG